MYMIIKIMKLIGLKFKNFDITFEYFNIIHKESCMKQNYNNKITKQQIN